MAFLKRPAFRRFAIVASIVCIFLFLAARAAQKNFARDILWQVVHNVCVPGQVQNHNPLPCLQVDLSGGNENGFAVLGDLRSATHILLIPTARISGIESPLILQPGSANYFADAWEARQYIFSALHKTLPRDDIGMAINSAISRSQDQFHIHVDCLREEVRQGLHKNEAKIANRWAAFPEPLSGRHYTARWIADGDFTFSNPFRLLAEQLPGAAGDMGNRTLVAIGLTRADGATGFVLLTDKVDAAHDNLAGGEELLDHACHIAATEKSK